MQRSMQSPQSRLLISFKIEDKADVSLDRLFVVQVLRFLFSRRRCGVLVLGSLKLAAGLPTLLTAVLPVINSCLS